ncbi:MAG: phosphotyrosine protein phosphatase [Flavobacteriales bacterium]|nr:phosphotyrosine protein phosphatase [Flavobacteriales bacterium]PIE87245.1 MAG: phosphotyrosine protein phosphatase [Bacteroidota bacterium]
MTNILFVCSANKERSKTADDYFSEKYPHIQFDSAGTNLKICQKEGTNPMTEELADWADEIIVMEQKHANLINQHTDRNYARKIRILHIPDHYKYYQKELIELLEEKVSF